MSIRVFVERQRINDTQVHIAGSAAEHLVRVLRIASGDLLIVQPGDGTAFTTIVREATPVLVRAEIQGPAAAPPAISPCVNIFQALVKGDRFETVLQRCTEIGAKRFIPIITERTVRRPEASRTPHQMARWQAILCSASEQCGRADIPGIQAPQALSQALESHKAPGIMLSTRDSDPLGVVLERMGSPAELDLFIGPEGGWADAEIATARHHNVSPALLETYTLRTETAALVAVSQILYACRRNAK
ncbi:MAG: 16S rRNA (uracil(1498)-N(3))-methyltransferase [Armatimonadetes bacterium]|nr:16S rRNA (uracil(1498)-N(3))-methyltransferase [Armatimonadota bacterium]MDE2205384.1 16S rRNA (uracil(1498)-N(3))-methyltransferase [Armatimonadota bacterium]